MITEQELDRIEERTCDPVMLRLVSELRTMGTELDRVADEYALLNMAIEAADAIGSRLRACVGRVRNERPCGRCGSYTHHQEYCTFQI